MTLLATPAAKGLFHKAIAQSASVAQVRTRDAAGERAALFLDDLGVAATDLERLADIPLEQILEAQGRLTTRRRGRGFSGADMQAFSPSPDGTSLLELPLDAIASGSAAGIPVIVGTNRDEIRLFAVWDPSLQNLDRDGAIARLRGALGDDAARVLRRVRRDARRVSRRARSRWRSRRTRRSAWTRCGWPTRSTRSARPRTRISSRGRARRSTGGLGACHALEIPFVFDNVHQPGVELLTGTGDDRAPLAKVMNAAWTAFARSGVARPSRACRRGPSTTRRDGRRWCSTTPSRWSKTRSGATVRPGRSLWADHRSAGPSRPPTLSAEVLRVSLSRRPAVAAVLAIGLLAASTLTDRAGAQDAPSPSVPDPSVTAPEPTEAPGRELPPDTTVPRRSHHAHRGADDGSQPPRGGRARDHHDPCRIDDRGARHDRGPSACRRRGRGSDRGGADRCARARRPPGARASEQRESSPGCRRG